MRDDLFTYVNRHPGGPGAILTRPDFSRRAAPQLEPHARIRHRGRVENCQIGVFLTDSAPAGRTLLRVVSITPLMASVGPFEASAVSTVAASESSSRMALA